MSSGSAEGEKPLLVQSALLHCVCFWNVTHSLIPEFELGYSSSHEKATFTESDSVSAVKRPFGGIAAGHSCGKGTGEHFHSKIKLSRWVHWRKLRSFKRLKKVKTSPKPIIILRLVFIETGRAFASLENGKQNQSGVTYAGACVETDVIAYRGSNIESNKSVIFERFQLGKSSVLWVQHAGTRQRTKLKLAGAPL